MITDAWYKKGAFIKWINKFYLQIEQLLNFYLYNNFFASGHNTCFNKKYVLSAQLGKNIR